MAIRELDRDYTFMEFETLNNKDEVKREYIEGKVYLLASPSVAHQEVSMRLSLAFYPFFKGKSCRVFTAPFDVVLKKEGLDNQLVIPDLTVICDDKGLNEKRYEGIPTLVVEILSPSNQHHDLVVKMNLYAKYGIQEYWIVNPLTQSVSIYTLDDSQHYLQSAVKSSGLIQSRLFKDLTVNVNELFDF